MELNEFPDELLNHRDVWQINDDKKYHYIIGARKDGTYEKTVKYLSYFTSFNTTHKLAKNYWAFIYITLGKKFDRQTNKYIDNLYYVCVNRVSASSNLPQRNSFYVANERELENRLKFLTKEMVNEISLLHDNEIHKYDLETMDFNLDAFDIRNI